MKILIADDEDYTREGLIEGIDWEEFGIDEMMQAVNGDEALKIVKWFRPDIVLTDIRMPKMDGIAFAEEMLKALPQSKLIFISGYMETEYLKSAIWLSAIDYIEKPIDVEQVKKALRKAVDQIARERKTREVDEGNRELRQQKLFELLTHRDSDGKTVEKFAGEVDFPLNGKYVCVEVQFPRCRKNSGTEMEEVLEMIREIEGKAIGIWQDNALFEVIIAYPVRISYRLGPLYQRILENWPECKVAAGIEAGGYRNIYNSCRTARAAMNRAFYRPEQRMYEISEYILQQKRFMEPGIYGSFLRTLLEGPQKTAEWFRDLFEDLYSREYYQKEQLYTLMVSLLTAVFKQFPESYDNLPRIRGEEQLQAHLMEMDSLQEIRDFTEQILGHVQEREERLSGYGRIIRGVMDYIAEHYGEESLSTAQIAEHFHFSQTYMNVIFKQEAKVTLKQYLSNYRLERAKKLLEHDYMKITEIAEKCGFANANYFAKVFRDATGMSPMEYRDRKKE
ncbi:MAG: response regulator [Acetatifactor sp.]|nr:response regulator [Acetatifactor sp.]MDE7046027.1 response regulator [Acetatifactor sp.]